MIYITGDAHALIDYDKIPAWLAWTPSVTREDYLIVAGDFAGVMTRGELERILSLYADLPVTVLFVDGNHENFDLLDGFPEREEFCGKVGVLSENVLHLKRGELYEIEGKRIFTFGGGTSIDKYRREEGVSWWARELPTDEELLHAKETLKDAGHIDYIITHSCPTRALSAMSPYLYSMKLEVFRDNEVLEEIANLADFDKWYFGHYHLDLPLDSRFTAVYRDFYELI